MPRIFILYSRRFVHSKVNFAVKMFFDQGALNVKWECSPLV